MKKGEKIKTAFDEYTLIKQVGSGGNGCVFSAINDSGESVAIKFIEKNLPAIKLKRFKNEIYFCEQHKHKNIVEIYDRGYANIGGTEYAFYVMPLYAETLRDKMRAGLNPGCVLTIFTGILEGLKHAHVHGAIHRDIKPENIMFKANSIEPIICDFGIAHFAENEMLTVVETRRADRMANFQYAAPEQHVKGSVATAQTDIYATALILNEMFTGEIPQAADYKTIASVAPEYAFVDEVFTQMFKQQAADRMFPEDKILQELKLRAEQHKREEETKRLQSVIDDLSDPETFTTAIVKKEFLNGQLVFWFDRELPQDWFSILSAGSLGSYSAVCGYGPEKLEMYNRTGIAMPLRGYESPDTVKNIVQNVADWIPKANTQYTAYLKQAARQKRREDEAKRKAEIERLEREGRICDIIASL